MKSLDRMGITSRDPAHSPRSSFTRTNDYIINKMLMSLLIILPVALGLFQRTARPLQQTCFNAFNSYFAETPLSDQSGILILEKLATELCPKILGSIESKRPF